MSKRKKKPWGAETSKLETWLYENEVYENAVQLSQYHWRLTTPKAVIDIWAGAKKFYIKGTSSSCIYETLDELKNYL